MSGRTWKLLGLAGLAGVAATGVVLARNERRRRAYTPDEIRARLHERHEATAERPARPPVTPFDPARVARYETEAWTGYYRREWGRVLRGALGMVHEGFGTSPVQTVRGAWWVLRANQAWAPFPDNAPDAARASMARFYAVAAAAQGWTIDPQEAARLEVAWWAAHRELQHAGLPQDDARLVGALCDLYSYVYTVPTQQMRAAAVHRARAMHLCDAWVADGCAEDDARLAEEEAELLLSYTALRDAVRTG